MGWSKGKGLGREETGTQDFLRVRYKNDAKGLGFVGRDDQWTQHEESFSGLLNTLNGEEENDNSNASEAKLMSRDESEDEAPRIGFGFQTAPASNDVKSKTTAKLKEKISGISLEEKSKQSRARVHYKKFTRGKDLSQYSEKDLANIFGRKEGEVSNNVNLQPEEDTNKFGSEIVESNANFLQTGISVSDYFKMKMEAKRKGLQNGTSKTETGDCAEYNDVTDQVQEEDIPKKKRKNSSEGMDDVEVLKKKKKKSKKNKNLDLTSEDIVETESSYINIEAIEGEGDNEEKKSKKSKKKSKNKMEENTKLEEQVENETINSEIIELTEQKIKKNKKKSKNKSEAPEQQEEELEQLQEGKKKRKKKQQDTLDNVCEESKLTIGTTIDVTDEPQKKKHKKTKKSENESNNGDGNEETKANIEDLQTSTENKKSKKKNKKQSVDDQEAPSENKAKDVSSNANSTLTKNVNVPQLELDDIKTLHNSYNTYRISSFCAEKFRNVNLNDFKGSILPQIEGYGFGTDIQLDVQANKNDEERITNLWKCVLNKYGQLEQPKKTYKQYVKDVIKARKMKQKQPKLYVKTWERKNAFQII